MRKHISLIAAAALMTAALPLAAEALPAIGSSMVGADTAPITLVAGGCGVGLHRGPLGGCRPNVGVVVVRRPVCRTVLLPLPHRVCR